MIQARRKTKTEKAENTMEDRINSVSVEGVVCVCVLVCERSFGDKQVYLCKQRTAAKHRPPRVWLRIQLYKKLQWHTAHANTHVQWLCQSHADVQSIPEACHKCSGRAHACHMCKSCKKQAGKRSIEWPRITHLYNVRYYCWSSDKCPQITCPTSYRNKKLTTKTSLFAFPNDLHFWFSVSHAAHFFFSLCAAVFKWAFVSSSHESCSLGNKNIKTSSSSKHMKVSKMSHERASYTSHEH